VCAATSSHPARRTPRPPGSPLNGTHPHGIFRCVQRRAPSRNRPCRAGGRARDGAALLFMLFMHEWARLVRPPSRATTSTPHRSHLLWCTHRAPRGAVPHDRDDALPRRFCGRDPAMPGRRRRDDDSDRWDRATCHRLCVRDCRKCELRTPALLETAPGARMLAELAAPGAHVPAGETYWPATPALAQPAAARHSSRRASPALEAPRLN
jgi:hypothetical protein